MNSYQVSETDLNKRVDLFLQEQLPDLNRAFIKKLADEKKIIFNNKHIKAGYKFKTLGVIELKADKYSKIVESNLKLNIIFEDEDIIVINKPTNILVHAKNSNWCEESIATALRSHCKWTPLTYPASLKELRRGIVHRLDRATSGVLVCAKNETASRKLKQQFKLRQVEKTYLAIVDKNANLPNQAIIDKPLLRSRKTRTKFTVDSFGRQAQTQFMIKKTFDKYYLLNIKITTGRTHQIRVHLKSLKCPIVGDKLYKGSHNSEMMLHAHTLSFSHPSSNQTITFKTPIPDRFKNFLKTQTPC